MKHFFTILVLATALAGCANRPESIHASFVPHEKFIHLDCAAMATRMVDTRTELEKYSEMQNSKATGDTVGVLLLGIPFSKLFGDYEGDVARLKGETEALEIMQTEKKCKQG